MSVGSSSRNPSSVLGAFCAQLSEGRRVAVLGDGSDGLAQQLASLSGRRVHAYDPDDRRLAASLARSPGRDASVSHAKLEREVDARQGAFDLVVLPDLDALPPWALDLARELVGPRGAVVVSSRNPDAKGADGESEALSYYDLYDRIAALFDEVRMLGEAPFVGASVADFAAGDEPPLSVDTSLMDGSEEPQRFVVVASDRRVPVDPYTIIEVPSRDYAAWSGTVVVSASGEATASEGVSVRSELAQATLRCTVLNSELDKLKQRLREAKSQAEERQDSARKLSARLAEMQQEAQRNEQARDRLKAEAKQARRNAERLAERLEAAESQATSDDEREALADAHQAELDSILERLGELDLALEQERARVEGAEAGRDEAQTRAAEAEAAFAKAVAETAQARAEADTARAAATDAKTQAAAAEAAAKAAKAQADEAAEAAQAQAAAAVEAAKAQAAEAAKAQAAEASAAKANEAEPGASDDEELAEAADPAALEAAQQDLAKAREDLGRAVAARDAAVRRADEQESELKALRKEVARLDKARKKAVTELREAREGGASEGAAEKGVPATQASGDGGSDARIAALEAKLAERERTIAALEKQQQSDRARQASAAPTERAEPAPKATVEAPAEASEDASARGAEVDRYENMLRERASRVAGLESDLERVRGVARELVRRLAKAGAGAPTNGAAAGLEEELATLRERCARQEANLKAASWTISALESDATVAAPQDDVAKLEAALVAARQKIEELSR